ncbi:MAG: DUF547 domain-containing protein [Planctomycetes bacterium]|nr:DUF547 domain-containing protein [Planctomycetota bacterium]
MKLSLALCLAALLSGWFGASAPQEPARPGFDHEHGLWSKVLAEFVVEGRVDYLELSKRTADLDRYAQELCTVEPSDFANWTKEQRLAFWLNAHNAFALQAMLLHYPLENLDSPRDIGGKHSGKVWKERNLRLGRLVPGLSTADLSLEELVERVLRPQFKDARVHAALTNGCLGAPALGRQAFTAKEVDRELTAAARAWIADPLRTRFSKTEPVVEASVTFEACRADFAREAGSVEAWILSHASLEEKIRLGAGVELAYRPLAYDWRLNDVERGAK